MSTKIKPSLSSFCLVITIIFSCHVLANHRDKYMVDYGETFYSISKKVYGTGIRWIDIYELNRSIVGPNPDYLEPGTILELPWEELRIHEVQPGENLWTISKKYLGRRKRFWEIYLLNEESIGDDPNMIFPGQLLLLPRY